MLVEDFILDRENETEKELMLLTHQFLLDFIPGLEARYKWKTAFYVLRKNLCYLNLSKGKLYIGFIKGHLMSDAFGKLEGEELKQIRHFYISTPEDIYSDALADYLSQALELDKR